MVEMEEEQIWQQGRVNVRVGGGEEVEILNGIIYKAIKKHK